MIRKKDLLESLDCLTIQVMKQGKEICLLKKKVADLKSNNTETQVKPAQKRSRGRPRKDSR